jgi:hypothetical protein
VYLNWKLVLVVCNDCASFCWFFFFVVAVRCIYQFVDVWIDYIWYVELGFALLIVLVFRILKNCRLDVISSGDGGTSVDFISMKIYFLYIVSLLPTCLVKCCGDEDDKMIDVGLNYGIYVALLLTVRICDVFEISTCIVYFRYMNYWRLIL